MTERCTLDGFVIAPIEPQGSRYAGTDHGRLCINEARTGVMAWWSMGRWTDRAAREAIMGFEEQRPENIRLGSNERLINVFFLVKTVA